MSKILFLNTDLGYGGAEKSLAFVANSLVSVDQNEVTFLTYRDDNQFQKLDSRINRVHIQLENNGGKMISIFRTSRYLRQYIKKEGFDYCVAFLSPSQLRLVLACKGLKTKLIFSHRGDPYQKSTGFIRKFAGLINHHSFCKADIFVFQTEMARQYYNEIKKPCYVIPNPIKKMVRTEERTIAKKRIVSVSRLDNKQKRLDILIEAFSLFSKEHGDYSLEIYGDGPDEEFIRELAANNTNIVLKGKISDIVSVEQNATMFVLSSDFEGIPNALMEAMSLGVPCISTRCSPGGAEMLITDKETGLLVDCGNAKQLANAMDYMANNDDHRESMGKMAMNVNERFAPEHISKQWIKVIESDEKMV